MAYLDNRTTQVNLTWDQTELEAVQADVEGFDIADFGFDILDKSEPDPEQIEEDNPQESMFDLTAGTKPGDMFQLGIHKLLCGSSTSVEDVARLMGEDHAELLFTSPPYSDMREYRGEKNLDPTFLANFIRCYAPYVSYQAVNLGLQMKDQEIYPYWNDYIDVAHMAGLKLLAWNVWDKLMCGSIGMQKYFVPCRHEWIFVFGKERKELRLTWPKEQNSINKKHKRRVRQPDGTTKFSTTGDTSQPYKKMESVLDLDFCSMTKMYAELGEIRGEHPATFPVNFPSEYIKAFTNQLDVVAEPFGGSGTTLIACQELNRKCRIMELDPHYCDIIIARWEKLTGQKAIKLTP